MDAHALADVCAGQLLAKGWQHKAFRPSGLVGRDHVVAVGLLWRDEISVSEVPQKLFQDL